METKNLQDVEFGEELPAYIPDTTLKQSAEFASIIGWEGARFSDHEKAKEAFIAYLDLDSEGVLNDDGAPTQEQFSKGAFCF